MNTSRHVVALVHYAQRPHLIVAVDGSFRQHSNDIGVLNQFQQNIHLVQLNAHLVVKRPA